MTITRRQTLVAAASLVAGCTGGRTMAFNDAGLKTLEATLAAHVAKGSAPGLVALVRRGEQTHIWPMGRMSLDAGAPPVRRDTIVRLASMTKPVTAAAALMLIEDGKLTLDEPVDRLLPELVNRRVLQRIDGPLTDTVPANRPITVEDVFSFRLGWGIVFAEGYPILEASAHLAGFGMPDPTSPMGPDEWLKQLGELPLMAQPGEQWLYTLGANVLGVLVARASGQTLPDFFQSRILGPLGMKDTAFWVPADKRDRFITGYFPEDGKLALFDKPDGMYARPPAFPAGDSGLVSTIDDYAAFTRFLQTGLAPGGERLITAAALKAMKTDRLTAAQRAGGREILGPGWGWGLGVGVAAEANEYGIQPGAYGWNGGFGTSWFTDPAQDLTAILLTQRVFDSADPPQLHKDFWKGAYAAVG